MNDLWSPHKNGLVTHEYPTFIRDDSNQRKEAQMLTTCEECRARSVKCERSTYSDRCNGCLAARRECFKAGDQQLADGSGIEYTRAAEQRLLSPPKGYIDTLGFNSDQRELQAQRVKSKPKVSKDSHWLSPASCASSPSLVVEDGASPLAESDRLRASGASPRITKDLKKHNQTTARLAAYFTRLRDVITKFIRPVEKLKQEMNPSMRSTEAPSLPCDPHPLSSPSVGPTHSDPTQPELDNLSHTSRRVSPQATVRPSVLEKSHESLKNPPDRSVIGTIRSDSSSVIPSTSSSCSWNTRETNLTGNVHLHRSHKVYDGPYSTVYQGVYDDGRGEQLVAIKVVRPIGPPHSIRRRRRREVMTGINLHHPNILPVYGVMEDGEFGPFGAIITPWCSNGNAAQYLHNYDVSPAGRLRLWRGVVDGLAHLHSHNPQIVHGDMKPPNVLIADDGRPMICDLGLARLVFNDSPSSSHGCGSSHGGINTTSAHTGTPRYLAPEQVDLNRPSTPTTASDVYAVGCIGFEFIYSIVPYAHREHNLQGQIFHDIRHGVPPARRPRITTPQYASSSTSISPAVEGITMLWDALESCWSRDPRRRPSASLLCEWLAIHGDVIVSALERRT